MKKSLVVLVLGCLAATSSRAVPFAAMGTISIAGFPNAAPIVLHGSGIGTTGGGILTLPAGMFSGNPPVAVPVSPTFIGITKITIPADSVGNPTGSFAPDGAMPLSGQMLFYGGGAAAGSIPLAPFGGGGFAMGNLQGIPVRVNGATWMGGNQVFTFMGQALANAFTATATAFDNRNASGFGQVQLVAPVFVQLSALGTFPLFATLTFVPEPGTLTLLGAGIALLVFRGRALGRKRADA